MQITISFMLKIEERCAMLYQIIKGKRDDGDLGLCDLVLISLTTSH
jgi:hypothetical protein